MPATPNIIDQLGTSWKLDVAAIATFSYQHPTFGSLVYSGDPDVPWLCDNVNTLKLTSKGTLPEGVLPEKVCIRPKYDGECGSYDLSPYNPPGDQCLCKDPGCDFTFPLYLTCNGVTDNCIGNFIRGTAETQCPATGPTYTAQCTLNSVAMEVRMYCAGGTWMADVWNDGVLCDSCIPLTFEGCPFRITGTYDSTVPCANDCEPCMGEDCDQPLTGCCCATEPYDQPPTLTAFDGTITKTFTHEESCIWTLSSAESGTFGGKTSAGWELNCAGDVWTLSWLGGGPPLTGSGTLTGTCQPMDLSGIVNGLTITFVE